MKFPRSLKKSWKVSSVLNVSKYGITFNYLLSIKNYSLVSIRNTVFLNQGYEILEQNDTEYIDKSCLNKPRSKQSTLNRKFEPSIGKIWNLVRN